MVIDENEQRGQTLEASLRELGYHTVGRASPNDYLPDRVAEAAPDVVLIDINAPSRDTLEQISTVNRKQPRPIVMFTQQEDRETIHAAIRAGVSAYSVGGLSQARIRPIIETAIAHFQRHQAVCEELEKTRTTLSERKRIEQAKGLLMSQRGLSEPEAYRTLQKLAMDRKKRLVQIADDVLGMASLLSDVKEQTP